MDRAHDVRGVSFMGKRMRLTVDGRRYEIDLAQESRRLAAATSRQVRNYELSPAGYGIHWPDVDEDLSIDALVRSALAAPTAKARR